MKILLINQYFGTRKSTYSARAYEFSRILVERGHDVVVICGSSETSDLIPKSRMISRWEIDGIHVRQINIHYSQKMGYIRRIFSFLMFAGLATLEALRHNNVDVYYASSTPLTTAIPGMLASIVRRKPFVFEARDLWPEVPIRLGVLKNPILIWFARSLERLAYRHASHVIVSSSGIRDGIVASGVVPEKVSVISNVADNDLFATVSNNNSFFNKYPYLKNRKLLIYAGAIGYANDLSYLIKIAEHVLRQGDDIGFLIVGPGAERELIIEKARQQGVLDNNLWVHPPVSRKDIPMLLTVATVVASFVRNIPALWSISPAKLFDSLAAGKPVVINCGGWQAELIAETGAGIVLPPDNAAEAARLLVAFMRSDSQLVRSGQKAKDLALQRFDCYKLAFKLEKILKSAVYDEQAVING